jgi:hypothetical protein
VKGQENGRLSAPSPSMARASTNQVTQNKSVGREWIGSRHNKSLQLTPGTTRGNQSAVPQNGCRWPVVGGATELYVIARLISLGYYFHSKAVQVGNIDS